MWKDKVIPIQEAEQLFTDVLRGRKKPRDPEHRPHFNCLDTIGRYATEQENLDKELESIVFAPMRTLAIMSRFGELNAMVEQETDKYYNRAEIKLED